MYDEHNGSQRLKCIVELKLLLGHVLWTLTANLLSFVMMRSPMSVNHFIGFSASGHQAVDGSGHADGTNEDKGN